MFDYAKRIKTHIDIRAVIDNYLPNQYTKYEFQIIDTNPLINTNSWHLYSDPEPFVGEVIDYVPEFMFIKVAPLSFRAVYLPYATEVPKVGCKVKVTPYARRNFDGERTDSYINSLKSHRDMVLAKWYGYHEAHLPISRVVSPLLQSIIDGIQAMPAPDGFRTIAEMLVDANASQFAVNDPGLNKDADFLPGIKFHVNTSKFTGELLISCNRAGTLLNLEARQSKVKVIVINEVNFEWRELGQKIASAIDDESWRKTIIEVLS